MGGSTADDVLLAEARWLIAAEDLNLLVPTTVSYNFFLGDFPVERLLHIPIASISPAVRDAGCATFLRFALILDAFRNNVSLPPVEVDRLPQAFGAIEYRLRDGFHRYYSARAVGFSNVPAIVRQYYDPDANQIPRILNI